MKAWQQKVINQTIKILILPLPEDYRTNIRDYRDQLRTEGYTNSEISILLLRDIKEFWAGLIRESIPDLLKDLSQRIDPNYWTHRIYKPYGYEAIEKIKNEFQEDFYKINLRSMQVSSIALIIFHVFLAVLDIWCLPDSWHIAWIIKLFVFTILSISAFITFKPEQFKKHNQQIIIASLSTTALGFILTMSISHLHEFGQYTYYGALMLLIFYMNLGSGLSFSSILIASIIILLEYGIVNHSIHPIPLDDTAQFLRYFNNTAFLFVSIVIGIVATNLLEQNIRLSFLIRFAIATQFKEFVHYFACHNIETFLSYIKQIRHSPEQLQKFARETFVNSTDLFFLPADKKIANYAIAPDSFQFTEDKSSNNNDSQDNSKIDIEKLFLSDYFYGSLTSIRLTTIFAIINYGGFGIIDTICLPNTNSISIFIRLIFCLIALVIFCLSYFEEFFEKHHQLITIILASSSAIGIISMIVVSKPTEIGYTTYYSGLIHVLFYIFTFSRLLFLKALILSSLIAIGYGLAATFFQNLTTSPENTSLFINNLLFLIICCVVGSISCRLMENNARAEFNTRYGIALKSKELLVYAETYKPSPQELLDMINKIRHNPEQLKKFLEQNLNRS